MSNLSAEPVLLQGHIEMILDAEFSADGNWLLTGSADDTARLWDMVNPYVEPIVLQGHGEMVEAVAISPDDRWIVTGSRDNLARLWHLQNDNLIALACQISGRNFTQAEWSRYFPGESYRRTCPTLPIHSSALDTTDQ
jgi:WD40 repeat protein